MKELFIKVSMVRRSRARFVIFNFLQGKVVCFGTHFQVACLDRVSFMSKKCRLCCFLHEDGLLLKRVSPVLFDKQKKNTQVIKFSI